MRPVSLNRVSEDVRDRAAVASGKEIVDQRFDLQVTRVQHRGPPAATLFHSG